MSTGLFRAPALARAAFIGALLTIAAGAALFPAVALSQDSERPKIVFIGANTEPFWQRIIKGFEQAQVDFDFEGVFRSAAPSGIADATAFRRAIESAIASNPDGLMLVDPHPEALNDVIKSAVDQGIPVVLTSAGAGEQEKVGAMAFVGLVDEYQNGFLGGEELKKAGATNAIFLTLSPGIPLVDQRTKGFIDGFKPGVATPVVIPVEMLSDTVGQVNALSAAFQKDPTIDGAFSIGSCCSPALLTAREQLGDRSASMHFGTIDLLEPVLHALVEGKMDFALDQQQYLQGYIPAMLLIQRIRYGFTPADDVYATGPAVVDASNAQTVLDLSAQNIR